MTADYPVKVHRPQQPDLSTRQESRSLWRIVIVTEGERTVGLNTPDKSNTPLRPRNVFVVKANTQLPHEVGANAKTVEVAFPPARLKMSQWPTRKLRGYQELFSGRAPVMHLDETSFRNSIALVEEIEKCIREKLPCWEMLADIHFRHLVLLLSRAYDDCLRPHDEAIVRMSGIQAWIEQHFRESIDLDGLAEAHGMSQRTFYRLFKRATGRTPLACIIQLRMQHAAGLLRNTDQPITQIAYDSGFSDSNYFAREFRKVIGESPTAYRQRWAD